MDERSSFSSILRGTVPSRMLFGITGRVLLDKRIVLRPFGRLGGRASAGATGFVFGALGEVCGGMIFPSWLLLTESDLSFGSFETTANVPGMSLLPSTFSDFRIFRLERFRGRLLSLFLDKSRVVSFAILRNQSRPKCEREERKDG